MRKSLLALILIPALALTALFGGHGLPTHVSPSASVHATIPCGGSVSTPC